MMGLVTTSSAPASTTQVRSGGQGERHRPTLEGGDGIGQGRWRRS